VELLRKLQAQGVPISGVGIQGHYHMDAPSNEQVDTAITAFGELGLKVMITELDVHVLPSPSNTSARTSRFPPNCSPS
jgi:endo-1,4-beta-xylanase